MGALRSLLVLLAGLAGCSNTVQKQQEQTARQLHPSGLTPTEPAAEEVFTARVRAYADPAYRAQNPGWQRKLEVLLRRANEILEPSVGLRLELVEGLAWERSAPSSELEPMMRELVELDRGADVDWVIGLVDALPEVTSSMRKLGLARPLGTHVILRGLNDAKEVEVLEAALGELERGERQRLYQARKKHKETLLLLHEVGHSLGAMHIAESTRVLNPSYDHRQESFHPENAGLMRVAARGRLAPGASEDELGRAVLARIQSAEFGGWPAEEREALISLLNSKTAGIGAGARAPELGADVRPADRTAFERAAELDAAGRTLEAWEKLEPLVEFYPEEAGVQILACRVTTKRDVSRESARQRCRRAAELAPDNPEPRLAAAGSLVDEEDPAAAFEALEEARAQLEEADRERPRAWGMLAGYYKELGIVSRAEAAADRAGDAGDVLEWAAHQRARYALPPNASDYGIDPPDEKAYVEAVETTLKAVYARDFDEARRLLRRAGQRYRGAPGIDVVRCDLEIRRRRYRLAARACERALRAYDGASWGHYLAGLLDKRDGAGDRAIAHLERAIELDPKIRHAYKVLADLYRHGGREQELGELERTYRDRFGYPLE